MCGFAGEVRFDGRAVDVDALGRMSARLAARGPDSMGLWQHGPIGLAHRRLTIIDLSRAGEQPMVDANLGLSLVFNGCIYNYRELRRELEGHGYRFFSSSDSEVILKAYAHWGTQCVEHFLGMFAFVIVERDSGKVVMARDRLGIKPLYVARAPGRLRFASTLPALIAGGGIDTSIDPVALHHYMTFHSVVPAPLTILSGVQKLPPATVRVIDAEGKETDHVYWQPRFERPAARSKQEWEALVIEGLRQAVRRRMVADVPVGVLLSGGIDSSLVVALLAESGQRDLKTFSIGFEAAGGESGDEFAYSDIVAKEFSTDHRQIRIDAAGLLPAIDGALENMSEPMISHDCVAFYLLSEQVSRHVKVVQSGQGADEIFAGYDWYPPLAGVPRDGALDAYSRVFFDQSHAEMAHVINPDRMTTFDVSREFVQAHFDRPGAETALDAALRIDSTIMLVDDPVKRVDNMTMAWGLEGRVPFLDHELVEIAAGCPPELKLAHGGKGVLKDAARKLLPAEIIDRKKGYFPVPGIRHLSGPLLGMVREALLCRSARERNLFRPTYVQRLLETPNDIRSTLGSNMTWQLGLLELWFQKQGVGG
ncbi:MAG TPA: N-acetylglutaminylglutamine amidotransferase [Polyangiaceae bacterium]|nr:N-acetylglutaminylglutamine amidotransferase [Polyangiaceae bacterium]